MDSQSIPERFRATWCTRVVMVWTVMRISVLGPARVTAGDRQVPLPAKQAVLLAILALQPNRTVSSDRLIEAMWGVDAPPDLVKTLQTHVFQLRRRLEPSEADVDDAATIVTEGHGYRLDAGPKVVDASVFLALVSDARAVSDAEPEHAAALLNEALALWRGPDVAEVGGEPSATAEIERLQEVRTSAVDDLIKVRLLLGETDALVADLRKAVSEAPYREQLWASLMLALARSGQRAQALLAYRDAETALRRELDVEPSRELQELAARIRDDDPTLANTARAADQADGASPGAVEPDLGTSETLAGGHDPAPTRVSRRLLPAFLLGVVALGVAVVVGRAWMDGRTSQATVPPTGAEPSIALLPEVPVVADSLAGLDDQGRVVRDTKVGALPDGVTEAEGFLWVANTTDGEVSQIDPVTFNRVETIDVGAGPTGIVGGFGSIWVANSDDRSVSRINASTRDVVSQHPVGTAPYGIASDDRWVWVTNRLDGTLSRIDPSGDTVSAFAVGQVPLGVTAAAGAIWVADYEAGQVVRVDPNTGSVVERIDVGNGPTTIASDGDALWVVDARDGTVSRIDPASGAVKAVIDLHGEPGGLAVGRGGVWVAVASPPGMVRIDPMSDAVTRYDLEGSPRSVWLADGRPLVTIRAVPTAHRGGTLRVVSNRDWFPTSLDPAEDLDGTGGLTLLTNDGLLGYQRVGGAEGATLVPDLAVAMPEVSDDGLSHVFRLRSGITFSTGAPVRPSDVVRSIERAASIYGPDSEFGMIVGADACGNRQPCDLRRGIVANDGAGTVAFHLTRRDPSFLYLLANISAQVVPADTPFGLQTSPLPATGPYRFARLDADGIELVRNERFEPWSTAAQPAGYPDRIAWSPVPDDADPSELVEAGEADLVVGGLSRQRVQRLATDYPAQLHAAPSTKVFVEVMNTTVPPFDDPDVRRAVNFAIDRQAALDAYGGPIYGRTTCQVMPPTFPGYAPYCPFTASPDANGVWKAANVDLARQLIDEAGAAGERVTVYGLSNHGHAEVAEYMVGLLNSLGFKATKRLLDVGTYFNGVILSADHPADMGMAGFWWGSTVPTAASAFLGTYTCPTYPDMLYSGMQPSELCDPDVDRLATTALSLEAAGNVSDANRIWQQIDRRVTNAAPQVSILNPTDVAFVSSRVGNFQHHLIWEFLLDQMWVVE
jgi:peptide/nickel transport system substrate-binding protein